MGDFLVNICECSVEHKHMCPGPLGRGGLSVRSQGSPLCFFFGASELLCIWYRMFEMAGSWRARHCCSCADVKFLTPFLLDALSCLLHFSVLTCFSKTLTNWNSWGKGIVADWFLGETESYLESPRYWKSFQSVSERFPLEWGRAVAETCTELFWKAEKQI